MKFHRFSYQTFKLCAFFYGLWLIFWSIIHIFIYFSFDFRSQNAFLARCQTACGCLAVFCLLANCLFVYLTFDDNRRHHWPWYLATPLSLAAIGCFALLILTLDHLADWSLKLLAVCQILTSVLNFGAFLSILLLRQKFINV